MPALDRKAALSVRGRAFKLKAPAFYLALLRAGEWAGVPSRVNRRAFVGQPLVLLNERTQEHPDPKAWAVVTLDKGRLVRSWSALSGAQREGVSPQARAEFEKERNFYLHRLRLKLDFREPLPLREFQPGRRFGESILVGDVVRKRDTAPIHPGGAGGEPVVLLDDFLSHLKSFRVRSPAAVLVGSLAVKRETDGDIDILIRGPLDDATRRILEFRIGRMLPPELSRRVSFLDDEHGGPFTDFVELGDLVFEARETFERKEMAAIAKQRSPHMELPPKGKGPRPGVIQYHFRGRSVHLDLRIQVDGHLIGWTLAAQKAGAIPADVDTVDRAREIAAGLSPDGDRYVKPFRAPKRVIAAPKGRMPLEWLRVKGEVVGEGEIGATAGKPGVIVPADKPRVEFGLQKAFSHEYFLTGPGKVTGTLIFRQLVGEGGEPGEEDAGRATPEGEAFWVAMLAKYPLPSVLRRRAIKTGTMPPDGYSGIPRDLERLVPPDLRYWEQKGAEARKLRDALVERRIFTEQSVRVEGGRYVVRESTQKRAARFSLSWQYWQRTGAGGRATPSRQVWHLSITDGKGGLDTWQLQGDPLANERLSGVYVHRRNEALLSFDGQVDPGAKVGGDVLNETKATPSTIAIQDKGNVEVDEIGELRKLRFEGKKLRGVWTLIPEEKGGELWLFVRGDKPGREVPKRVAKVEVRDGVQIWDPDRKDPDTDREQLRPLAIIRPQKPSRESRELGEIVAWPSDEMLRDGVAVEPKINGFRVIAQRRGDKVLITTEDKGRDISSAVPGLVADLRKIAGVWMLDAEFVEVVADSPTPRRDLARFRAGKPVDDKGARLMVFDLLYHGDKALVASPYTERRRALERFVRAAGSPRLMLVPSKVVKDRKALRDAVKWASRGFASEGAMLKWSGSTYSLGGETSSWAKLRTVREIRAMVVDRHAVKGSPGVWNYVCAVGPTKDSPDRKVSIGRVWYTGGAVFQEIGKTFNTSVRANKGDVLRVEVSELLVEREGAKIGVSWFLPVVIDKVSGKPHTVEQVVAFARPDEQKQRGGREVESTEKALTIPGAVKATILRILTEVLERALSLSKAVKDATETDEKVKEPVPKEVVTEAQALAKLLQSIGEKYPSPVSQRKSQLEETRDLLSDLVKAEAEGDLLPFLARISGVEVEVEKASSDSAGDRVVKWLQEQKEAADGEHE